MRLIEVKVSNFRKYRHETAVEIASLTVLVGCNDAGKSTLLEALDIFFNDATIEKDDCSARSDSSEIRIACVFDQLPDEQPETDLQGEYLVRGDGNLEIVKTYTCASGKGRLTGIAAHALAPSAAGLGDLHSLKLAELKARAQERGVDLTRTNKTLKAELRRAIWEQSPSLDLVDQEISLLKESGKEIWDQIEKQLPVYALFKSDRASTDQDAEAQDPMKAAIKEAIRNHEAELDRLVQEIKRELERVAGRTVEKIREMNEELARELKPQVRNKNWDSLFSVTLTGENDIPINKRGSGARRLVLLNFFRARVEEASNTRETGVIYAIEEPETSQHPNYQIMLLDAFQELVEQGRCQILLTTHTPNLARRVPSECLRFISASNGAPAIHCGNEETTLKLVRDALGVLPDHGVRAFLGVEGKHDINFLKRISKTLSAVESDIPNLELEEQTGRLVFMSLGGGNLEHWVSTLARLERPEFYLTDRDNQPPDDPKYHRQLEAWRARGCRAWATGKRELENYLHLDVLTAQCPLYAGRGKDFDNVPQLMADALHRFSWKTAGGKLTTPWPKKKPESHAKYLLNTDCVARMTPALLRESDPQDELRGWLREIGKALAC